MQSEGLRWLFTLRYLAWGYLHIIDVACSTYIYVHTYMYIHDLLDLPLGIDPGPSSQTRAPRR